MNAPLVEEVTIRLTLNGTPSFEWRCTPTDVEAMVVGRLYIAGVIVNPDDLHLSVNRISDEEIRAAARVDLSAAHVSRQLPRSLPLPAVEVFTDLFRALFNTVDARHESGGMHAAAATDGMRIIRQVEDVGRHNTIDKITGVLLLEGLPIGQLGLLTSSRVSGEIAHKTAIAGFSWLASRSIPTTLAVRFAKEAHMPIIGRAAGKTAHVYS